MPRGMHLPHPFCPLDATWQVLEIGGVATPEKRYKIIIPENLDKFPRALSLTTLLLYSPKALRRITNFARGKRAYIVPSIVGPEERLLALALGIPLLAPAPTAAAAFGSKSGSKRVFSAAQVNMPPSHAISRHLTPSHAFSRLLTPSHAFSRHLTPSHAISRHLRSTCPPACTTSMTSRACVRASPP